MSLNSNENDQQSKSTVDIRFEKAAFKELFNQHYPSLCIYCKLKYGFDIDLAEDVVHASFIKLWERRHFIASGISPTSYLYKIIDNRKMVY